MGKKKRKLKAGQENEGEEKEKKEEDKEKEGVGVVWRGGREGGRYIGCVISVLWPRLGSGVRASCKSMESYFGAAVSLLFFFSRGRSTISGRDGVFDRGR